eukprot:m51a1_g8210 hypothetical protein (510) ;mRNA; f:62241-64680
MASFTVENSKKVYEELCAKAPECANLWRNFLSLSEVPRPSGHTQRATEWAIEVGKKLGAQVKSDAVGNVVLLFPATPGMESLPGVVLQAHLDMVGTKTDDSAHDFTKDPLQLRVQGNLLKATKTTLGGDDGSGVAAAIAIAEDKNIKRGQLELMFTVDEEVGLVGAMRLKEGELLSPKAKYLVNVDSEDWGEICVSCAGSVNRTIHVPVHRAPHEAGWQHLQLKLKGFKGGHTGVHIHLGRANALKWAITVLCENQSAIAGTPFRISALAAGNAHNAVPISCTVDLAVPAASALRFIDDCRAVFAALCQRWAHVEEAPALELTLAAQPAAADALTYSSSRTALRFLESLHHGVWAWSEECPSLVETSQSVSKAGVSGSEVWTEVFARSSRNEALAAMAAMLETYATLYGGRSEQKMDDMPGWPAEPHSRLCTSAQRVYAREFGHEAKVVPIHAGLECGIVINKFPANKIEAVSVGPTVLNPHTVNEEMHIDTCVKLYHYLVKLVEDLAH